MAYILYVPLPVAEKVWFELLNVPVRSTPRVFNVIEFVPLIVKASVELLLSGGELHVSVSCVEVPEYEPATAKTEKLELPAAVPPGVEIVTAPVVAPCGTAHVTLVADHEEHVAATLLNFTVPAPCVLPKFVPVMVTESPTCPDAGEIPDIAGAGGTENVLVSLHAEQFVQ